MTPYLIAAMGWMALLTIAIYLIAYHVGNMVRHTTPSGARFEHDGPRIGEKIDWLMPGRISACGSAKSKVLLFKSTTCAVCSFINTENLAQLKKYWQDEYEFYIITEGHEHEDRFDVVEGMGVAHYNGLREKLNVNYVPFALKLSGESVVMTKGLINSLGNLESLLEN